MFAFFNIGMLELVALTMIVAVVGSVSLVLYFLLSPKSDRKED
jgi:hypothetical protein